MYILPLTIDKDEFYEGFVNIIEKCELTKFMSIVDLKRLLDTSKQTLSMKDFAHLEA